MRRLPVYLLIDTSGSMRGEPVEAVNTGIRVMASALRRDPHALETVHISIITFDARAKVIVPLTAVDKLQVPQITTPQAGPTHLGQALETLGRRVRMEVRRSTPERKGDWAPYLFVMTDGRPSDIQLFQEQCSKIRQIGFANIIGCVAGPKSRRQDLAPLCDHVVALDTMDAPAFTNLFEWVTTAISSGNQTVGTSSATDLPPPPPELQIVV